MRQIFLSILLLSIVILCDARRNVPKTGEQTGMDLIQAMQYCNDRASESIEGIWQYPEEGFSCLIRKQDDAFIAIVLESCDAKVDPGMVIAHIYPTPSANVYDMYIYSGSKNGVLTNPKQCVATLDSDGQGLALAFKKYSFCLGAGILPWMWRLGWVKVNNPMEKLPHGLIKVCPLPGGGETFGRHIIWL